VTRFHLYAVLGVSLVLLGVHAAIMRRHLVVKLLSLNVAGAGTFLLLISVAFRNRGAFPDAVPHAMVLTGIVVAVSVTALGLTIIRRLNAETGRTTLDERGTE
jgi:multicomponent Na+:H+ antiporter subunit C